MNTASIDRSKIWTVDDFLQLEETNTPCELINGELIMSPAPKLIHQEIASSLNDFLKIYAKQVGGKAYFSPVDVFIDRHNVYQPDLLFLSKERLSYRSERGIEGPPDLVIEVISPSNFFFDRNVKKKRYLDFGVKEYWIIDPAYKAIEIFTPEKGPDMPAFFLIDEGDIVSSVLKDFKINLKEIFTF